MDGKWGIIDASGSYILEPKYNSILKYSPNYYNEFILVSTNNTLIVSDSEGYKIIDLTGKTILSGISEVNLVSENEGFPDRIAVKINGNWEIVDLQGQRFF